MEVYKTMNSGSKRPSTAQSQELLHLLQTRFDQNPRRHAGLSWAAIRAGLEAAPERLWSLAAMERTGGEPDVVGQDKNTGEYLFMDCSAESPTGRRSLCYDPQALSERKEAKPAGSAVGMASEIGVELLNEAQYRALQELGPFDQKTSSWLSTPPATRQLGGAIFAEYRYGTVFVFHNSAPSYYGARGFRGLLKV